MADMYDLVLAKVKLGVAMPVVNDSFRWWNDPGTWALPTAWTGTGVTLARSFTEAFDADQAALTLSDTSIPNDLTQRVTNAAARFWNDNMAGFASLTVYFSWCVRVVTITTPGASVVVRLILAVDSAENFPSATEQGLSSLVATDGSIIRRTGTAAISSIVSADRWCRAIVALRDAAAITAIIDNVGIMFNPFDTAAGFYEFPAFAETPDHQEEPMTAEVQTPTGSTLRFDPSGGARKQRLVLRFDEENISFYEELKRFYDINHGSPGLPGLPLLIEPNLPAFPPTMLCNILERPWPFHRQGSRGSIYGGTLTFEAIHA